MDYTWHMSTKEEKIKIAQMILKKDETFLKEFGEDYIENFIKTQLQDYTDEGQSDL